MPQVFISYRHTDSKPYVGRLYDRLITRFDKKEVFRDIDSIKAGEVFLEAIDKAEASCDALIAVIGPGWLTASDDQGRQRLADPNDTVRREIETALVRKLCVVSVLVGGAKMPEEHQLPGRLAELWGRRPIELSEERYDHDFYLLVEAIGGAFGELRVALGSSLATAGKLGLIAMKEFEILVDGEVVGRFGSRELKLGQDAAERRREWNAIQTRIREGVHTIAVRARGPSVLTSSSKPLMFRLKGGQSALFVVEQERQDVGGTPQLLIRPLKPILEA